MLRDDLPDQMDQFSPSVVSVYQLVRDEGLETRRELREETILADGTIATALHKLHEAGYLEREPILEKPDEYRYSAVEM
jgi:DNA-binding MarR family transcriptional regulator